MFSYLYSKPVIPPPLNTINDPLLNYTKMNDVNILESRFKNKSKSPDYYNYSNEQLDRAKRSNKYSTANLNMGVELARKGSLPNIPENQYIFEELSRRNNIRQEKIRQQEFANLQKEHASNMPERIRQNKRTRHQFEEQERRQYEEYKRRQQEEYEEYQRQEQATRQRLFEEQERRQYEEQHRRQYEEQQRQDQERLRKEQEYLRQEQERRQRLFEEKEQERLRKEQEYLRKEQEKEAEQVINLPTGITDINQCPAFKVELPTDKLDCNRSMYKKIALNLHPDKNHGCTDYASSKFQELAIICNGNQFVVGGRNKRKTKKNKKKTKKHQKRKQKTSKKKTKNV